MIDIDTDTYIGSPPRGGGSGETRIVERTVSLYRLRMQVVHLVDSAQGIIDAIDEAESESNPRVRFAYEEDVLGNYWDYLGIPELIEEADDDGDTGYWPNGVPLYLSIVSPSDFPSPIEVWFQNWSDANNRPFANLEPTTRKTDFANYDGATYSAYTVNITACNRPDSCFKLWFRHRAVDWLCANASAMESRRELSVLYGNERSAVRLHGGLNGSATR